MSKIGDTIAQLDGEFDEWFQEDLVITNYEAADTTTAPDEFDDPTEKQPTADSPIGARGQVDPVTSMVEAEAWGRDIDVDVILFVDDEVTISDGTVDGLPYPSDVELPDRHRTYRVTWVEDEGNGLKQCFATSVPERGD